MPDSFVLIVSTIVDVATDEVVRQLSSLSISHKRINSEDFPFSRSLAIGYGEGVNSEIFFDGELLPTPSAIWYRRFRAPSKPQAMDEGVYEFCIRENRAALLGGIVGLSGRWMSHPSAVWLAEYKPYQLAIAKELGLQTPKTIISNNIEIIKSNIASFGRVVVKPVRDGHVLVDGVDRSIFTTELVREQFEELSGVDICPVIFQELIPKKHDVRVTIVGEQLFAVAIDSQSDPSAMIDWRHTVNPDLPHRIITLPDQIQSLLRKMMLRLNLNYAAIDLIETPEGDFIFLEVNPNGQWLWLDDILGLGISRTVALWLAGQSQK